MKRVLGLLLLSLALGACSFETQLEGLDFECSPELPCGEGFICDLAVGTCGAQGTEALPEVCLQAACSDEGALRCSADGLTIELCQRDTVAGCLIWAADQPCAQENDCQSYACETTDQGVGCTATNLPNGALCDDENPCTLADACQEGYCIPGEAKDCDDGVLCTKDACDSDTGQCVSELAPGNCLIDQGSGPECMAAGVTSPNNPCMGCNPSQATEVFTANIQGTPCDDENVCTTGDVCDANGQCFGPGALSCDDKLSCTDDSCDPAVEGGCVNALDAGACVIANQCWSQGDTKPGGDLCLGCFPEADTYGWSFADDGASCDDGELCTVSETCGAGVCQTGVPKSCSDGLACTTDTCDGSTGGCESILDEGSCLIDGACRAAGALSEIGGCMTCDPSQLVDGWVPLDDGTGCSDQNPCTLEDSCAEGICLAGSPKDCADAYACTVDSCDVVTGACKSALDGGHCLVDEACVVAGSLSPQNTCLACQPATSDTAYTLRAAGSPCDDSDVCTLNDACDGSGGCSGGQAQVCDDGLACTTETCVSEGDAGCVSTLDSGSCVIDAACVAAGETSVPGGCLSCDPDASIESWTASSCDDGLACTSDLCVAESGTCDHELASDSCLIAGVCYGDEETRPENACEVCAPTFKADGWTPDWGTVCHPYPGGEAVCDAGVCQFSCPEPLADCDANLDNGCEIDLSTDLLHCGACANLCTGGMACVDGQCTADCGELSKCGPYCVDKETSLDHCGECGYECAFLNAQAICAEGECSMGGCASGFVDLNGIEDDGCECENTGAEICDGVDNDCDGEVDNVLEEVVLADPMNCGGCGEVCLPNQENKLGSCSAGVCSEDFCPPDTWNLDGSPDNGCEYGCSYSGGVELCDGLDNDCDGVIDNDFDLLTNTEHCGECGAVCEASALAPGVPDAVAAWTCVTGACFVQKCEAGWVDKDMDPTNGCEHAFAPEGVFHVHWLNGNDFTADGSADYPFQTIQGALDNITSPDWTVLIGEGVYDGGVVIPEALEGLKLTGAGMDVTIVESLDLETGITIEAHGVTLSDFLITGGDVGIFAHGQAETPITGLVLERLVLDGIENPTIQCSHCYHGDGGEDGGCTSDGANKQCFFSDTIGIDLAYTQGAQVSLVTFSSIEGARAPGTSFWYFLSGRPAIGLQVSDSTGLTVSANQITGPLKGGLGQKKQNNRSAPSGASIGMLFRNVQDSLVSGNLIADLTGTVGKSAGSTGWGAAWPANGGDVIGVLIEGDSEGLVLTGNTSQNLEGGAGGAGYNGITGGVAIGVKMQTGAQGATLTSNTFEDLKGGLHSGDGGRNVAYGVWFADDSLAHDIDDTNVHEGDPIVYVYGADGLVLEDLQLTGPGNPTNLGKLAIVASQNVTVSGGEFAHQRGPEGLSCGSEGAATSGGRAVGILLRDCEGCVVQGATVHHIEGGRGGNGHTSYTACCGILYNHSQGPGSGGWAAGIALEGAATVGGTLSGNVLHDLDGGSEPHCGSDVCIFATEFRQGAMGVYVAEEAKENTIDETNLFDEQPILYRYGAEEVIFEGYTIDRKDQGTNWGQVAIFESANVTLRDMEITGVMGIQGTDVGWNTPAVQIVGAESCVLEHLRIHDVEAGKGQSAGMCKDGVAGGMVAGLYLKQISGLDARNVLIHDLRGGASGSSDCVNTGPGGGAYGILAEAVDGSIQHLTVTDIEGGAGATQQATESFYLGAQSEGQVVILRNSILTGATSTCLRNLETNPAGALQVYNTGVHVCGVDFTTWSMNVAMVSGNLFVDPLFMSPSENDYRLSSASPHIDAGFPDEGLCQGYANEPSPNGCAPNMGYYGNTEDAMAKSGAEHCSCQDDAPDGG